MTYRRRDMLLVSSVYYYDTPRAERLHVIERVAEAYGFTVEEVLGDARYQPLASVRQLAMRAVSAEFNDSLTQLGRLFNRDHTTVLYALQKSQESVEKFLHRRARPAMKDGPAGC